MKQICIAGRTGKASELRRTQDGTPVLAFSVAVDDGWGQNKSTIWFDCSLFGKRAESLSGHIGKGDALTVTGELGRREHAGKTYLTVRVNELAMQGGGKPEEGRSNSRPSQNREAARELDDTEIPF